MIAATINSDCSPPLKILIKTLLMFPCSISGWAKFWWFAERCAMVARSKFQVCMRWMVRFTENLEEFVVYNYLMTINLDVPISVHISCLADVAAYWIHSNLSWSSWALLIIGNTRLELCSEDCEIEILQAFGVYAHLLALSSLVL